MEEEEEEAGVQGWILEVMGLLPAWGWPRSGPHLPQLLYLWQRPGNALQTPLLSALRPRWDLWTPRTQNPEGCCALPP